MSYPSLQAHFHSLKLKVKRPLELTFLHLVTKDDIPSLAKRCPQRRLTSRARSLSMVGCRTTVRSHVG